jgi:ABC-type phosphate/phosphonate transport system substrate-binding protein
VSARIRMGVALSEIGRRTKRREPGAPEGAGPTRADLDSFCAALSRATGLDIVAYAAPRYDRLLHRLKVGEVELAWLSPVVALAALRAEVVPVALPSRGDSPWYWSALFTRDDSPLTSVERLASARAVWVDEESASGYLVMRAALASEGFDVDHGFRAQSFALSHDEVVREVMADPSAVGATYLHLDAEGTPVRAGWGRAPVRVLKRAGPIPSDVLAASSSLPVSALQAVQRALCLEPSAEVMAHARSLFGADHFAAADPAQLAHLRALERWLIKSASLPPGR